MFCISTTSKTSSVHLGVSLFQGHLLFSNSKTITDFKFGLLYGYLISMLMIQNERFVFSRSQVANSFRLQFEPPVVRKGLVAWIVEENLQLNSTLSK